MRLIDADALLEAVGLEEIPERFDPDSYVVGVASVLRKIFDAPTIEDGPVVRCADCMWSGKTKADRIQAHDRTYLRCMRSGSWNVERWYCADGERETIDGEEVEKDDHRNETERA